MRWGGSSFARIVTAAMLVLSALLAVSGILVRESGAEGISGYLEFKYDRVDTENKDPGGRSIEIKSDTFTQQYSLTLDRKLYPNLNFLASGNFLDRDTTVEIEGLKNDTTTTTLRPYVNLNLRTPLYYAEGAYSRNEEKEKTAGHSLTTVRDAFVSTLYWKPDRFPDLKLQYLWDHHYDKERLNTDTASKLYLVTSNYLPVENLRLYYQGSFRDTDLRLSDTTVKETIHNGRVNYSNNWWRRRITFGADYNITNQEVETTTTGIGEVGLRLFPFAGLSKSSDTPGNVVLDSNPALIDPDLVASAGINLGPPRPGDSQLRNMGLDFLAVTEINTLYVSVDRDVALVADAFSWEIFISNDDPSDGFQIWDRRQTVSPAIYSPTFNRFEIRFTNVAARYVKVVTAPLSPTIPFASAFPDIFVTGIQAEIRRPASEVAGKQTSTFQNGTADFRALILEALTLTYEFTYVFTKKDPGELQYTVSNGLSFFRQLNKVFSGKGRVAFENGEEQTGKREALVYSASLTAIPFRTFRTSLLLSGRDETIAGKNTTTSSVFLYNIATLYEGIDANLSGGISLQEEDTGRKNTNTQGNAGVTFVPNRKVNLTLLYNGTTTETSGGGLQETTNYTRTGEADLAITPVPNVYLFGSYRIENTESLPSKNIMNYSLSWSPFPDGTLHLTFYYTETIRSDNSEERSIIPSLRWYFMPRSYLDLSYENLKVENPALTTLNDIYSGTVRITF
jgi:hypothetical protein